MGSSLWQGTVKVIAKAKEKPTETPGRETMTNLADITSKHVQSTRDTNPNEEFMKVKEFIRETSVLGNYNSSTKITHSFWPPAALARYEPAGRDFRPGACTSGQEQNRTVCAHMERRWLWQQHVAAKTLNLHLWEPGTGWSRSPTASAKRTGQRPLYLRTRRLFFQSPVQDF